MNNYKNAKVFLENADLTKMNTFRIKTKAEKLFYPKNENDLIEFLTNNKDEITVIGAGSNILIRDLGIKGVVINLRKGFNYVKFDNESITVGAGTLAPKVAKLALGKGISGLEFLIGVPGTIGACLKMNAGAFGGEMKQITISAKIIDKKGLIHLLPLSDLNLSYRSSTISEDYIITEVRLKGIKKEHSQIHAQMEFIQTMRKKTQPLKEKSAGSVFKNPFGKNAEDLISAAGCVTLSKNGAFISSLNANWIINNGNASADDIEVLAEEVRAIVFQKTGIQLEWEVIRMGSIKNVRK